jgi:hypothetical protein
MAVTTLTLVQITTVGLRIVDIDVTNDVSATVLFHHVSPITHLQHLTVSQHLTVQLHHQPHQQLGVSFARTMDTCIGNALA